MKQPFSDEILSAYVDGELSAQERAEVEAWLEENSEAREKLDEFRRLSGLFASLARTEVPREFPTKVLQLAERRMLLPEVAGVTKSLRLRRWAFAIGAPVASAAVLVLMLQSYLRDPAERRPPAGFADEGQSNPSPALAEDAGPGQPRNELEPAKGSVAMSGRLPAGVPVDQFARTHPELVEMISRAIQDSHASGGENKSVPVVRVYIADSSAEGMVLMQNVLIEHEVLSDREDPADEQGRSGKSPDSGLEAVPAAQRGTEALFVIAEPERLMAAFSVMLAREHPSLRLTVEEPIEIAALDDNSQRRLRRLSEELAEPFSERHGAAAVDSAAASKPAAPAERHSNGGAPSPADDPKSDGKPEFKAKARGSSEKKSLAKQPQPGDKREMSANGKDAPAPENAEGVKKEKKDSAAVSLDERLANRRSRQMIVPVPREIEQRGRVAGKSQIAPEVASREMPAARPPIIQQPARDEKAKFDDTLEKSAPSLVRVLIVIEREGTTQPPAGGTAPAAKKGPSGGAS